MYTEVDWSKRGEYIARKHGISVAVANEALHDSTRVVLVPDPASKSGEGVRIIGWSDTFAAVITVIVVVHDGHEYGSNAWRADGKDLRRYYQEAER